MLAAESFRRQVCACPGPAAGPYRDPRVRRSPRIRSVAAAGRHRCDMARDSKYARAMSDPFPKRIVCLTEEPTEVLYAIGESQRIVGISGFTVRPARARREKPKVSAFISAKVEDIVRLDPDLAIGFSDIQADIAQALIRRGVEVWISNHRSVAGILAYVRRLGAMVGAGERSERYARELEAHVAEVRESALRLPRHPRVYFEEWDEPQISGIRWVSELVGIAGGHDVFPERASSSLA